MNQELVELMKAEEQNKAQRVPEHTMNALNNYIYHQMPPGWFLEAVLTNNLKEAFGRADAFNTQNMFALIAHCYNNIPSIAWGSVENYNNWLKRGKE